MRRVLALVLALGLVDCAALQSAATLATASVDNPVTPERLKSVEDGMVVAFAALKGYKKLCVAGTIPQSCRTTIASIQVYTRKLPPILVDLRAFVRNNDKVNAVIAYNTAMGLISDFKKVAAINNVPTGGV